MMQPKKTETYLPLGVARHSETDERLVVHATHVHGAILVRAVQVGVPIWRKDVPTDGDIALARADLEFRRGVYRHYKGGFYQALCVASFNDTDEHLVVYVSLTGAHMPGPRMHCRPLAMWSETVDVGCDGGLDHVCGDGCDRKVPRFSYVGDELPPDEVTRLRVERERGVR